MNYVGIDYHKKYSHATAIDEEGRVIRSIEIAEEVIEGATYENLNKRGKKKILVYQWAIDKVRHYWREANKMVNVGWNQI